MNQHKIAAITYSDNLFGTEEIGISVEELFRQRPEIGNTFVSNELIDGENLYVYRETISDDKTQTAYYYYVYKDTLVGVSTDYILRKPSEDFTEDELFKAANESMASIRNAVEERYGLEGTFNGIYYKYDGDILKNKPTINGMWKDGNTEIYITTSLKEYDDAIFTVHLTYGAVTTDKITQNEGQETAPSGIVADSEKYVEDRFVTFTFYPDGENEVECRFKVTVYKENINGIEETFVRNIRYEGQEALSAVLYVKNDTCYYTYEDQKIRADISGIIYTGVLPRNDLRRYEEMNYDILPEGIGKFGYSLFAMWEL